MCASPYQYFIGNRTHPLPHMPELHCATDRCCDKRRNVIFDSMYVPLNPFGAQNSLHILIPSNISPKTDLQLKRR